jgi:hypothetical protein
MRCAGVDAAEPHPLRRRLVVLPEQRAEPPGGADVLGEFVHR